MTIVDTDAVWLAPSTGQRRKARTLAQRRLDDRSRRHSPDRPSARNIASQVRGAIGEIMAAAWLTGEGFTVHRGYNTDTAHGSDLTVDGGIRIEVMTAQIGHREITGYCVPPNKLWAAVQRDVLGYLFVGVLDDPDPVDVWVQAFAFVDDVDRDPAEYTTVRPGTRGVLNHVVRPEYLHSPARLLAELRETADA